MSRSSPAMRCKRLAPPRLRIGLVEIDQRRDVARDRRREAGGHRLPMALHEEIGDRRLQQHDRAGSRSAASGRRGPSACARAASRRIAATDGAARRAGQGGLGSWRRSVVLADNRSWPIDRVAPTGDSRARGSSADVAGRRRRARSCGAAARSPRRRCARRPFRVCHRPRAAPTVVAGRSRRPPAPARPRSRFRASSDERSDPVPAIGRFRDRSENRRSAPLLRETRGGRRGRRGAAGRRCAATIRAARRAWRDNRRRRPRALRPGPASRRSAVSIRIGAERSGSASRRSRCANCTPLSPGIITSSTMRSKAMSASRACASCGIGRGADEIALGGEIAREQACGCACRRRRRGCGGRVVRRRGRLGEAHAASSRRRRRGDRCAAHALAVGRR